MRVCIVFPNAQLRIKEMNLLHSDRLSQFSIRISNRIYLGVVLALSSNGFGFDLWRVFNDYYNELASVLFPPIP
jgi:hypothetical protein